MSKLDCINENQTLPLAGVCFTPEQANKALVLVRRIVADIVTGYRRLIDLQEIIEAAQHNATRDRCDAARKELIRMVERLQSCLEELDDVGVELRDWALGVVSFPSRFDGRDICLNWQHGEPTVAYWHEVDENFGNRQPLSTLMMEQVAVVR